MPDPLAITATLPKISQPEYEKIGFNKVLSHKNDNEFQESVEHSKYD